MHPHTIHTCSGSLELQDAHTPSAPAQLLPAADCAGQEHTDRGCLHAWLLCRGSLAGAMWALDFCQSSGRAVYAGRDGQALISSPHFLLKQRRRSPHSCFAGGWALLCR